MTLPDRPPLHDALALRQSITPGDRDAVRSILNATGFFRPDEVEVALELVDERIEKGAASGYEFLFAEKNRGVVGYACYGPIACTIGSFDLYWIAVAPSWQKQGLGATLLSEVENRVRAGGGRQMYIETSGKEQYSPTRAFYQRCGYEIACTLADFYDDGDDKVVWRKVLDRAG